MKSWTEVIADDPLRAGATGTAVVVSAVAAGFALRVVTRRTRSLHHLVLAITLSALGLGAVAALGLTWLMVLERDDLEVALAVIAMTAALSVVLALVASVPLARDARRLESAVRSLQSGDRSVRTGVERADELGQVAAALDDLTERLDRLERERAGVEAERQSMLTSVGHDLRTPLSALRAAVEALADGVAPDPERYLRSMARDVEVLGSLVDDLFLLSRIEAGRVDPVTERVDLAEIADEVVEGLVPVASQRQVELRLTVDGPVPVQADGRAIGRVVRNLVDNAIRHSPTGAVVHVDVTGGEQARVCVADDGPGFPAEFVSHAFERFARADVSRARATGGAGLGLAIARGLVEAHGGRIWVDRSSAPQSSGARVAFELPTDPPGVVA